MDRTDDLGERTKRSHRVYEGGLLSLRVDTVELPDGRETSREVVEHPGSVVIVPLLGRDRVVLVRQFRQPAGEALLELPAGTLSRGEDPDECADRELVEETGYRAGRLKRMFSFYTAPGYSSELIHAYLATDLVRVGQRAEEDEFIQVLEVEFSSALQMIERGEIRDGKTICGILYTSVMGSCGRFGRRD
ncbi:MAG: NUDIX domain-containing protein [Candidatus Bathyarchaeia archaeon]